MTCKGLFRPKPLCDALNLREALAASIAEQQTTYPPFCLPLAHEDLPQDDHWPNSTGFLIKHHAFKLGRQKLCSLDDTQFTYSFRCQSLFGVQSSLCANREEVILGTWGDEQSSVALPAQPVCCCTVLTVPAWSWIGLLGQEWLGMEISITVLLLRVRVSICHINDSLVCNTEKSALHTAMNFCLPFSYLIWSRRPHHLKRHKSKPIS